MKGSTLTVIRAEGTNEIIDGYNPLDWQSPLEWVYLKLIKNEFLKN